MLEPAQIRAARGLLGWRQEDLSKASGVGTATIQRIEKGDNPRRRLCFDASANPSSVRRCWSSLH
ncbi:MAG: helix-turn-helix transcriptional regulator [Xanthobacteraceae bacterium]